MTAFRKSAGALRGRSSLPDRGRRAASLLLPQTAGGPDLAHYKFTPLTQGETSEGNPQWSPDGKSIAYEARTHGIIQIFTRSLGSDAAQLTRCGQDCFYPFWSPDGAVVYYLSGGNLWSVPAAGGAAKEFWQGPANGGLNFSPDGSKLAVIGIGPVWALPYPSGAARKFDVEDEIMVPSWFPDSRHLGVAEPIHASLSVFDVAHGTKRTIVASPNAVLDTSVSPDGKRIAFSSGRPEWDVLEISIPNGQVRTLISGGVSDWADWAPSGSHFIFSVPAGESP